MAVKLSCGAALHPAKVNHGRPCDFHQATGGDSNDLPFLALISDKEASFVPLSLWEFVQVLDATHPYERINRIPHGALLACSNRSVASRIQSPSSRTPPAATRAQVREATAAMPPPALPNTGSVGGDAMSKPTAPCTTAADAITLHAHTKHGTVPFF